VAIVRDIVTLACPLRLRFVAESTDSMAQRDMLVKRACTAFRGCLLTRPLPIEALAGPLVPSSLVQGKRPSVRLLPGTTT
jgi:EAL domain-containing protein (putative c-di-GMP-specific phosphodiesterase class I)